MSVDSDGLHEDRNLQILPQFSLKIESVCSVEMLLRSYSLHFVTAQLTIVCVRNICRTLSVYGPIIKLKLLGWGKVVKRDCRCQEYHIFLRADIITKYIIICAVWRNLFFANEVAFDFSFMFWGLRYSDLKICSLPAALDPGVYSASNRNRTRNIKIICFWGVKCGWCVGWQPTTSDGNNLQPQMVTTLPPSEPIVLNISQHYRPPRSVTGIALRVFWKNNTVKTNPCGGGLECLHRSPASHSKRRQKENPVPGGITGPPCSWRI
jgi:hypothetical protein